MGSLTEGHGGDAQRRIPCGQQTGEVLGAGQGNWKVGFGYSVAVSVPHVRDPLPGPWRWLWAAAFLAVLGIAAYLRFAGLGVPSLWLDEILHVERAQEAADAPWHAWLTGVSVDRENGALYYASQLLAQRLASGETAVRLMPALAGLAAVAAIFFVGLSATGSRFGAAVVAALLAVSPLHVYYAREGRPYAAVMLLAALLLLLALAPLRRWTHAAVYGLCIAAAYWGAVAAPVLIACAGLASFEWLRTRRYGHFVLAAVAGLVISWLLFPEVQQLSGATVATGKHAAQWDITRPLSKLTFDRLLASLSVSGVDRGSSTGLSFVILALALWGGICLVREDLSKAVWVVGMCLLPIAGSLAVLVLWKHWYNVRYTSAGLPAFLVLVGLGLVALKDLLWRWTGRRVWGVRLAWVPNVLLAAALVVLLAPLWRTARAEPLQKPDWRGMAELIGSLALPGEPVISRDRWAETCIRHYMRQLNLSVEVFSANYDLAQAKRLTARYPRAWVLAAGYRKTPEFQAWMHSLDPIHRSQLANLQLFFFPDFATLLSVPGRGEGLASVLAAGSGRRQEFADAELLLGAGWAFPERDPEGMTFRWATADRVEIGLMAPAERGARALRLRLMPFPSPDRPPQHIGIEINDKPLTHVTLEPGWNEIALPQPAAERAVELVTFDFAWRQSPRDLDPTSGDPRQLAVAFDFVETVSAAD